MGDVVPIVATECVDSFHCTKTRKLVSASVVEMHDCCAKTPIASNHIFQCVLDIGGLCSTGDYPRSTSVCKNSTCQAVATVNGGKQVPTGDETAMKAAVYTTPVFALVDASHPSFQLYRAGTYIEPRCSSSMLDHALQVVGYGSASGVDYWICKNSWGVNWGMQGYIYIARNKGNMCGIASFTLYHV
ncbi:cysteine proteinase 3-like [Dreissena polymorpha]|nr:cysteine proteinase 3-like [Dreissena polymorpha]XP_052274332.1 cysteine proteinase 3-like [Dreissena polymorpha]